LILHGQPPRRVPRCRLVPARMPDTACRPIQLLSSPTRWCARRSMQTQDRGCWTPCSVYSKTPGSRGDWRPTPR
jgi:hypothetical protein